jgi:hypothetical protein
MLEALKSTPIFFIVGRPRSGTTLLRCLLDAHPKINIPLECAFAIQLAPKYGKYNYWDEKKLRSFYNDLLEFPMFHFWIVDSEKLKTDLLSCVGAYSYSVICKFVYLNYKSFFEKDEIQLIGDKNPSYSLYTDKLIELFPEAKFIHITRDYRDNAISMIRAKFESPVYSSLAYRWKYFNQKIDKQKNLTPNRFYTIKYEDLVTDPVHYSKEICDFLGVEFSENMIHYREKINDMLAIYPSELINKYHKSLLNPINNEKNYNWKKTMTAGQVKTCDMVLGSYAEKCGYERQYKKYDPLFYISCIPGMIFGHLIFVFIGILQSLPWNFQMKIVNTLASIFGHHWKKYRRNQSNPE